MVTKTEASKLFGVPPELVGDPDLGTFRFAERLGADAADGFIEAIGAVDVEVSQIGAHGEMTTRYTTRLEEPHACGSTDAELMVRELPGAEPAASAWRCRQCGEAIG